MYNVNQILDRTFDNWSTMLGANEFSFWAVSVVEMKPTPEIETPTTTTTTTPVETQEWEPADTTDWSLQSSTQSSTDAVVETSTTTETDTADTTDAMSATLENLTETAQDVFEEFNPFRDPDENS